MAGKDVIIDDDYCKQVSQYFEKQGQHLDEVIAEYIKILQFIKNTGIRRGDVSKALKEYIQCHLDKHFI